MHARDGRISFGSTAALGAVFGMRTAAFQLYLLFIVSWFLHLPARIPVLGEFRVDLLLVGAIGTLALFGPAEPAPARANTRTGTLLVALIAYAVVTLPFVEWPGSVLWFGIPGFVKAAVFYFFTSRLVTNESQLRRLLVVFTACQVFRVLEPTYLHVTQGYWGSRATMADWQSLDRLSGAPYDTINPNGLAFVVLTVIPFLHYLSALSTLTRVAYFAVLPVSLYALTLTGSRSGALGLAIVAISVWVKSQRKVLVLVLIVLGAAVALPYVSADLRDRYLSIVSRDTRNAATAQSRIDSVFSDLRVAMRRPLLGHGLGTSREANANFGGRDLPSHNLYTEVAQELGFVGLGLFVPLIVSIALSLRGTLSRLKHAGGGATLLRSLAHALEVWLVMNVLFSLASYGLSSYEWYFLAGLSDVVGRFNPLLEPPRLEATATQASLKESLARPRLSAGAGCC